MGLLAADAEWRGSYRRASFMETDIGRFAAAAESSTCVASAWGLSHVESRGSLRLMKPSRFLQQNRREAEEELHWVFVLRRPLRCCYSF